LSNISTGFEAVCKVVLMSCLSAVSLRLITPNWIESLWGPEEEQRKASDQEPSFDPTSLYKWSEQAVHELENKEV
jgi:hypothetical protein